MNRSSTSLRSEIADLKAYLNGLPEKYVQGPLGRSYGARLDSLLEELSEVELRATARITRTAALDLRVKGREIVRGMIPAEFLGELIQRWQTLFSALAQAAVGRATTRGLIPADILSLTKLDVVAFAEGSFITRLVIEGAEQTNLDLNESLGVRAFDEFEALCLVGTDAEALSVSMHRLQGRVLSAYSKLLQLLDEWDSTLTATAVIPSDDGIRRARMDASTARLVMPLLNSVRSSHKNESVFMPGILSAAHLRTRKFEIDLGDEGTIIGHAASEGLLSGAIIGERYRFQISEIIYKEPLTGAFETSWLLEGIEDLPQ